MSPPPDLTLARSRGRRRAVRFGAPFRESCRLWPGLLFVKDYAKTDSKTTTEMGTAAHGLLLGGGVPIVVVVR